MDNDPNTKCLNCGTQLNGKYCHNCGLKVIDPKDKSISKLAGEFFSSLFLLENKFFLSLKMLLLRPSELPRTYIKGITNRYLKPIQFFLIGNLIYFLIPHIDTLEPMYQSQYGLLYANITVPIIESVQESTGYSKEKFVLEFNQATSKSAKLIVIIIVPLLGFMFFLLNFNRKDFYATDHMVVAMYFFTFIFLVILITIPLTAKLLGLSYGEGVFTTIFLSSSIIYSFFIFKDVYENKIMFAIVKSLAIAWLIILVLHIFRLVLLFVTLASILL